MSKEGKSSDKSSEMERKILENLVELQKVNIHMADKFDKLAKEISNLLNLFETAARTFAQQPSNISTEKDKEFLQKIDRLLDQNKTIAKGLTIMEERIKERVYGTPQRPQQQKTPQQRPEEEKPSAGPRPLPGI